MEFTFPPGAQKFIDDQIKAGHFRSPDEVLQEALGRMMAETELELDDPTIAAINRADEQIDRGEGIDFDAFAAQWRKKLAAQ